MDESGYERELFSAFFEHARAFAASPSAEDETESALRQLAQALHGPAAAMLGSDGTQFWALTAIKAPAGRIAAALEEESSTMLLSQLSMLNESLNTLRSRLGGFGAIALGAVSLTVLGGFGWRRGGIMLLAPAVAGAVALATAQWVFGSLNIFHLIGCFLGGAIALDYALFSVTAFARDEPMPYSVWLSAATTGASFLALVTSYVPAVRSLGFTVAAIAFATIALLLCSQSVLRLPGFLNTRWRS